MLGAHILPGSKAQEESEVSGVPISLSQAVELALVNNLEVELQKIAVVSAEASVRQALGQFDPTFGARYQYGEATRELDAESSVAAGGLDSVRSESTSTSASVSGLLPTSTRYSGRISDSSSADTFNDFAEEHNANADFSITQPLLKGRGWDLTTMEVRIARRNLNITWLGFKVALEDILLRVEQAYWNLLLAIEDLEVRKKSVAAAQSLVDEARAKLEVDAASEADVVQAESGLAQRLLSQIEARRTVELRQRLLKDLIFPDLQEVTEALQPTDRPSEEFPVPEYQDIVNQAMAMRVELQQAEHRIANADDQLLRGRNNRLPQVDLEGSYGYNGLGSSYSGAFSDIGDRNNPSWTVGLVYSKPWPDRASHASIDQLKAAVRQQTVQAEQVRRGILLEAGEVFDNLKSAAERVKASRLAVRLARLNVENEKVRYEVNQATLNDVLRLEAELAQSETGLLSAIADYQNGVANLRKTCGTMLDFWNIRMIENQSFIERAPDEDPGMEKGGTDGE
jgi:outer membrane protein TolC